MDEERLVEDLKFKEMCKLQIFNTQVAVPSERYNLVVACNKYGYLYIGYDKGIKILKTAELTMLNSKADKSKETVTEYPHVAVQLGCMPHHLALSADGLTLSVCFRTDDALVLALYDVRGLIQSGAKAIAIQVIGQGPGIWVTDLCWNPSHLTVIAACLSDGSLLLCETSAGVKVVARMQKDSDAKAICWSPKGKQLVVGKGDGSLVQYDLQLTEKRRIQKPYTFDDRVTVVDVCWLSTYKFIAAYADTDGRLQPNIVTISAPKDGDPMFANYEDICMGDGDRQGQYYLKYIDKWEIVLAMQSNGADMGLMGKQPTNPNQWEIWNVNDDARLTLPLNANNEDTFPLGITLDTTSELVQAGGKAAPIVITLSTEGKLCSFYMIYEAECQVITSPPEALPSGQRQPIDSGGGDAVVPSMPAPSTPQPTSSGHVNVGGTSIPSSSAFSFAKPSSTSAVQPSTTVPAASAGGFSFSTPAATSSSTGFPTNLPFGQSSSSAASGFSFSTKTAPTPAQPQAPGTTGFSFSTKTASSPAQPQAPGTTGFSFSTKTAPSPAQPQTPGTTGFSFSTKTASTPVQPQAPGTTGFSFSTKTLSTPAQPPATGITGFASKTTPTFGQPAAAPSSSSGFSFAPKTTPTPSLPFGQSSTTSGSSFSFSSSPQVTSSGGIFSGQPKTAFTPSGSQSQKVITPGMTSQAPVGAPATTGQSAFSLSSSSSPFSFVAPKVSTDLPQTQAQPVSAFSQLASKPSGLSFTAAASSGSTGFNPAGSSVSQGNTTPTGQLKSTVPGGHTVSSPAPSAVNQPFGRTGNVQFGSQPNPTVNVIKPLAGAPSTGVPEAQARVLTQPRGQEPHAKALTQPTTPVTTVPQVARQSAIQSQQGAGAAAIPSTQASPGSEKLQTAFSAKIQEEMELFSRELKSLRQRAMVANYVIGTEDEKKHLRASIDKLTEFRQESVEVTKSINEDIHHLKSDTLNAFSLIEEAKLREHRNNDPRYVYFLKARSLDPATLKKLQEIRSKHHNLEVGLKDVNACLDAAWDEQQFTRGRRKRVLKPPTLDAVYQTLSNHHNIISSLGEQLKVVKQRLREAQCYDISAWPSPKTPSATSLQDVDMSSVTKSMSRSKISDAVVHTPISAKKRSQLKDLLSQRSSTPIRSAKKGHMSQMMQFSSSRLGQDVQRISARPLNLAKELEGVDGNTASQPRMSTPASQPRPSTPASQPRMSTAASQPRLSTPASQPRMSTPASQPRLFTPPSQPRMSTPANVVVERNQQPPPVRSVAVVEEPPKPNSPPTSPIIKTTAGKKTVEWGASTKGKLTPSQAAGVAAVNRLNSQQMVEAVMISQTTPAEKDLAPVVNIGKLESMKESMPPPVTFAPVGSSVNAGTAKVLNDVIAEMAMASGKTTQQFTRGPKSPVAQLSPTTLPISLENLAKPQPTSVAVVGPHPNISAPIASAKAFTIQPDASAFSLTSPAAATAISQPLKLTASPGTSSLPSFGFNSVSSTGTSFSSGFSFNSKETPASFSFAGAAAPSSGEAPTTKPPEAATGSQSSGFSFVKPSGGRISATSAATPPSVISATPGSGFSFGTPGASSFAATSTTTTSTAATSFSFGGTAPSSSSSSSFGFGFNKPNTSVASESSPFSFASVPKATTPASSTSPSFEEVPKLASTGKTAAAVGNLDITATGGSAMPANVKGQELNFPHQESSPTQVIDANVEQNVTPTTKPAGGFSFSSTGAFGAVTETPGIEKTPASTQSLLATPASTAVTQTSNKNLMGLLTSDDEPAPSSATSATTSFAATSSATGGFSFGKPPASTMSSVTTAATSTASSSFGFGQAATSTSSTSGFSFGSTAAVAAAPTSSGSLFGQTSPAFGSIAFGSKTGATGAGSSFGSSSLFGQKPEESASTTGLTFGSNTGGSDDCGTGKPAPSGFSFSAASDASKTPSLPFGQATAPSSAFGQTPSFGSAQPSTGGSSIFGTSSGGGMLSGLGGQPSAEAAKINPFGVAKPDATSTFGGTSLFGSQKEKQFGGTDEAGAFGSPAAGPFSSNTGGFSFGQTASQGNAASGFGSPPSFGGGSGFGSTSFGSNPAFSAPMGTSTFGAGNNAGGGLFSAFANNDTPGFGNIANQGSATFATMGDNQPSAFGAGFGQQNQASAGFGQQNQGSVFGGASTFGGGAAAPTSPFGGGGGNGQAFSGGGSPFGSTAPAKSPSFSGWR